MNVSSLMTKSVKTCGPEDTLDLPARLMWENDIGCVPVMDEEGRARAMLTDRDICMAGFTQGRPLGQIPVKTAMSSSVHAVGPHDPVARAERMMQEFQVRRLPVVDDDGRLLGLISMNDIAREAAHERPHRNRVVSCDEVALTLASVSRPRLCAIGADELPAARASGNRPHVVSS